MSGFDVDALAAEEGGAPSSDDAPSDVKVDFDREPALGRAAPLCLISDVKRPVEAASAGRADGTCAEGASETVAGTPRS